MSQKTKHAKTTKSERDFQVEILKRNAILRFGKRVLRRTKSQSQFQKIAGWNTQESWRMIQVMEKIFITKRFYVPGPRKD